jgi:hypothetical protein
MVNKEKAVERVREFFKTQPAFTKEQIETLAQLEETAGCKKCGKVIYCGVNTACNDPECGLKNGS